MRECLLDGRTWPGIEHSVTIPESAAGPYDATTLPGCNFGEEAIRWRLSLSPWLHQIMISNSTRRSVIGFPEVLALYVRIISVTVSSKAMAAWMIADCHSGFG